MKSQTQTKSLDCAEGVPIVANESTYVSLTMLKHYSYLAVRLELHLTLHVLFARLLHASIVVQSKNLVILLIYSWSLASNC